LKHALVGLALGGALASLPAGASAHSFDEYSIGQIEVTNPSPQLRRTRFSIEVGEGELDTFDVVRVHKHGSSSLDDPPVILLSPFGFQSEFWELTRQGYNDSFVARIARAGYDVWLVDNRSVQIAPGSCESGAVDCSPMAEWGIDTGVEDAMYVRHLVQFFHPLKKPVIGGLSGGSSAAIASVDLHPRAFSGLFMWEGTLFTEDPAVRARNAAFCAQDEAALASGAFVDPSVQGFKLLFDLANSAPNAPSPLPGFPPGITNLQALLFAVTLPNPASPLNFTDGFVRLIGDPFAGTLTYSDIQRLLLLGPLVGTYAPIRFVRDSHCAIAGSDTHYTDHLDAFRGDVLVYAEGFGFGQMMLDTAALMTRARVTVDHHPEFGESDPYFHREFASVAVRPLLRWLRTVRFTRPF
jgi:pimeloyl-ACP methyl ester carboxylesterase